MKNFADVRALQLWQEFPQLQLQQLKDWYFLDFLLGAIDLQDYLQLLIFFWGWGVPFISG